MIPRAPENQVLFCETWRDGMGDEVMRISFSDGEGWEPGGIRSMPACFFWCTFTHNSREVLYSAPFGWIRPESLRKETLWYAYGRRKPGKTGWRRGGSENPCFFYRGLIGEGRERAGRICGTGIFWSAGNFFETLSGSFEKKKFYFCYQI